MQRTIASAQERLLSSMFKPEAENEKYEIQELIGTGGFGTVHKVMCRVSGVLKAMKKLPFHRKKLDNAAVFLREIQNILQIKLRENKIDP